MPMIDIYAVRGTFADPHQLAADAAATVMALEQVPDLALFRQNTAAFVHDLDPAAVSDVDGDNRHVRVQVLTNADALDRDKQLAVVERLTTLVAEAAGDPTLRDRTWVPLTQGVFQVGLSWAIVFGKRDAFRRAFRGFDVAKVAAMTERDVDRLVQDASIIRNRGKIQATIDNARAMMAASPSLVVLVKSYEITRKRAPASVADLPKSTPQAEAFAQQLKSQGYRFVGPTSVYAFMQNVGVVNDHVHGCFRATDYPTRARVL